MTMEYARQTDDETAMEMSSSVALQMRTVLELVIGGGSLSRQDQAAAIETIRINLG